MSRIWSTPQPVFDKLNAEFEFQIDVCADPENAKCEDYYTRERGLQEEWTGMCFMNPPYGRGKLIDPWIAKAHEVAWRSEASVVCLIPSRTNPPWWHTYVMQATEIRFVLSKLSFSGGSKGVPFWGNAIVVFEGGRVGPAGSKWWRPFVSSWDQPNRELRSQG